MYNVTSFKANSAGSPGDRIPKKKASKLIPSKTGMVVAKR